MKTHDNELERSVLGGLMQCPELIREVYDVAGEDAFQRPAHREVLRLLLRMSEAGEGIDPFTVLCRIDEVCVGGRADRFVSREYVAEMPRLAPAVPEHLVKHAKTLRRHLRVKRLQNLALAIEADIKGEGQARTPEEAIARAEQGLTEIVTDAAGGDRWQAYADIVPDRLREIGERLANRGKLPGTPTGIPELDRRIGGLEDGCVYLVAGRPAMGKSLLEDQIARSFGRRGMAVGKFQLEMAAAKVAERAIVAEARVDNGRLRAGEIDPDTDWRRVCDGADRAAGLPVYVDDTPGLSIGEIRSRARQLQRRDPRLKLVTLDYIQLATVEGMRGANREERLATISKGLKVLAKELSLPVIVVAQLSRACEQRENRRPLPSDLRESGQLEQDADAIILIYRDEVYTKTACTCPGVAELIVAKARDGELGTAKVRFRGEFYSFDPLDDRHESRPSAAYRPPPSFVESDEDGSFY